MVDYEANVCVAGGVSREKAGRGLVFYFKLLSTDVENYLK